MKIILSLTLPILFLATSVQATVLDFTFSNYEYNNGATLTGSFTIDTSLTDKSALQSYNFTVSEATNTGPSGAIGHYYPEHTFSSNDGESILFWTSGFAITDYVNWDTSFYINTGTGLPKWSTFVDGDIINAYSVYSLDNLSNPTAYQNKSGQLLVTGHNANTGGGSSTIPEPASLSLLGLGLAGFIFSKKKRNAI